MKTICVLAFLASGMAMLARRYLRACRIGEDGADVLGRFGRKGRELLDTALLGERKLALAA